MITASTLINSETEALKDQLWDPGSYYLPDWADNGVPMTTSWRTAIVEARSDAEQRFGLVDKPYRVIDLMLQAWDQSSVRRLRGFISRLGKARTPIPIAPDRVRLDGRYDDEGATFTYTTSRDLALRRYFVGGRVLAGTRTRSITNYRLAKILDVDTANGRIQLDRQLEPTPEVIMTGSVRSVGNNSATVAGLNAEVGDCIVACVAYYHNAGDPAAITAQQFTNGSAPRALVTARTQTQIPGGTQSYVVHFATAIIESGEHGAGSVVINFASAVDVAYVCAYVIRGVDPNGPLGPVAGTNVSGVIISTARFNTLLIDGHIVNTAASGNPVEGQTEDMDRQHAPSSTAAYCAHSFGLVPHIYGLSYETGGGPWTWTSAGITIRPDPATIDLSKQYIWPVIEADLDFAHEGDAAHRDNATFKLGFSETPGISALDGLAVPGSLPSGFPTHTQAGLGELPILSVRPDWRVTKVGAERSGETTASGIGRATDVFGSRPASTIEISYTLQRAAAWSLLRFFDSRGGRTYPFWLRGPLADIALVNINNSQVRVSSAGAPLWDWNLHPYFALQRISDGEIIIRKIASVVREGDEHLITLDASTAIVDSSPVNYRAAPAYLCRFDKDEVDERWLTEELMQAQFRIRELTNEQVVAIALDVFCGPDSLPPWTPLDDIDICPEWCEGTLCRVCNAVFCPSVHVETRCMSVVCNSGTIGPCSNYISGGQESIELPLVSCIGGVARFEQGACWVELDTNTGTWTFDLSCLTCEGEVVGPDSPICCFEPAIPGCDTIIENNCSRYSRKDPIFDLNGQCVYVETILITHPCAYLV